MTCRAVGALTCTGATPSGEQLGYDGLRRLLSWQNTGGTASEAYAYDGAGERIWRQTSATSGSTTTTTTTSYVLGVEEVTSTAVTGQTTTTSTTSSYPLPDGSQATRDGSGLHELGLDLLGTPTAALDATSGVVGVQLRAPYGQPRYSASAATNGGMHTTFGFTGQREDTQAPCSSGLDYFHARYYDPAVGRFAAADAARPGVGDPTGQDAYAYVGGMVERATDPSGHCADKAASSCGGAGRTGSWPPWRWQRRPSFGRSPGSASSNCGRME